MKSSPFLKAFFCLALCGMSASSAYAALIASDNASDAAYNSGFNHGTNGGSGFGAWVFNNSVGGSATTNSAFAGEFIGDSSLNGNGSSGNINVAGKSWGLYSNTNNTAAATRSFLTGGNNSSSSLGVSESFSLKMDNGFLNNGQTVGFGLQNSSGTDRLEFYFTGGSSSYDLNIAGTQKSTSLFGNGTGFTADGLAIKFHQLGSNGWTLDVTPNGGSLKTYSSADFGNLVASDISQVRLFDFNNGAGGSAGDAFFNNLQVVPEPSSLLFGMFVGGCFLSRRRRR